MKPKTNLTIDDIVKHNANDKVSGYESILLTKLKKVINNEEATIFLNSFYAYLKYDPIKDFVVDLDNFWIKAGFSRKDNCKRLLEKNFENGTDYIIQKAPFSGGATSDTNLDIPNLTGVAANGGLNRECILITVDCMKNMFMLMNTECGKQMRSYYLKIERVMFETLHEIQRVEKEKSTAALLLRDKQLEDERNLHEKQMEQMLIDDHKNHGCVYLGTITNNLVKYGSTNNIYTRVITHRRQIPGFKLVFCIETDKYRELERAFEKHPIIDSHRTEQEFEGENKTELVRMDEKLNLNSTKRILKKLLAKLIDLDNIKETREHEIRLIEAETRKIEATKELNMIEMQKIEATKELNMIEMQKIEAETKRLEVIQDFKLKPQKICNRCHELLSLDEFHKDSYNKKDGHMTICRRCSKEVKAIRKKNIEYIEVLNKECKTCHQWLSINDFHVHSWSKDGHRNDCKKCCIDYGKRSREKHKLSQINS